MWEFGLSIPIPNWAGFCVGSAFATILLMAWAIWLAKQRDKNDAK